MKTIVHQGNKTEHLERLRARAKELFSTAFGPHKADNHEELAQQWQAVSAEISTLESSFILYQGREIEATLVNYLSGNIPTSTVDHDGDEELFRDERGCYYLRRTLNLLDSQGEERPASGRTHVHRINVNAAILWATTRLNSNTLDLRCDAANLLMEGRGLTDPYPVHLNAGQRAMIQDPSRFVDTQAASESPETVTVPLTLPLSLYRQVLALGAYDGRASFSETVLQSVATETEAWLEQDDEAPPYLRQYESELDAGAHPELWPLAPIATNVRPQQPAAKPGRIVVELDNLASAMLRRVCQEGNECREAGEDPRDLVNAAVTFYLCGDKDHRHGQFNLDCGDDVLARAKNDRLTSEKEAA